MCGPTPRIVRRSRLNCSSERLCLISWCATSEFVSDHSVEIENRLGCAIYVFRLVWWQVSVSKQRITSHPETPSARHVAISRCPNSELSRAVADARHGRCAGRPISGKSKSRARLLVTAWHRETRWLESGQPTRKRQNPRVRRIALFHVLGSPRGLFWPRRKLTCDRRFSLRSGLRERAAEQCQPMIRSKRTCIVPSCSVGHPHFDV